MRKFVIAISSISLMLMLIFNYAYGVKVIRFVTWGDTAMFDELGGLFTKKRPDIKLEVIGVPAISWGELFDKMKIMVAGGDPPDIAYIAIEGTQLFAEGGLIIPLDKYIERDKEELKDFFSDAHPKLIEVFKYKGYQYSLPFEWNNMVIFYNQNVLDDAGVAYPVKDWTVDDFIKVGQKVSKDIDGDGKTDIWGYHFSVQYFACLVPWMFLAGGNVLNDDWTQSRLDDSKTIDAVKLLTDFVWKYKISPLPEPGQGWGACVAPFVNNRAAFFGGGRWPVASLRDANFTRYDVQYMPKWRTQNVIYGVGGYPIFKASKNPDEAWEFAKFLTTYEAQAYATKRGYSIPGRRSVAYSDSMFYLPPKNARIYYESLDLAIPVPSPPEYGRVESVLMREFSSAVLREKTPEAAMAAAHREISDLLKARRK